MKVIRPKALLLDLDDTIISFEHGLNLDECWRKSIQNHLPANDAANVEELISNIKEKASWYWSDPERHRTGRLDLYKARQEIISSVLMKWDIHDLCLAGHIAVTYGEERDKAVTIFPDSVETIKQFRASGIKLALLTNGNADTQWIKIRRFDLPSFFDCIVVEGDLGVGKPDERIYLHALEQLGSVPTTHGWLEIIMNGR